MSRTRRAVAAAVAVVVLVGAAGCGDDDSDAAPATSTTASTLTTATTGSDTAPPTTGDEPDGEFAEYCARVDELQVARQAVADAVGDDPATADPAEIEAAVTGQIAALEAAAALAPERIQDDYATAIANLQELARLLAAQGWDYATVLEDTEFAKVATDADASLALTQIQTFDIGKCGLPES